MHRHPAYDHINAKGIRKFPILILSPFSDTYPSSLVGKRNGTQPGDPPKAARAMYELATMPDPPLRCIIGSDAYQRMTEKLETYQENVKKFEKLSLSTDVDE